MTLITIVLLMNLKLNVINEFNKNYKYRGTKLWIINLILQEIDSLWLIQSGIDDVSDDLRYIQRELSDIQSYLISL